MDKDLKEALAAIKWLRAVLWTSLDPDGKTDVLSLMDESTRDAFLNGAKVLAKHNDPDDMMNVDIDNLTGGGL